MSDAHAERLMTVARGNQNKNVLFALKLERVNYFRSPLLQRPQVDLIVGADGQQTSLHAQADKTDADKRTRRWASTESLSSWRPSDRVHSQTAINGRRVAKGTFTRHHLRGKSDAGAESYWTDTATATAF